MRKVQQNVSVIDYSFLTIIYVYFNFSKSRSIYKGSNMERLIVRYSPQANLGTSGQSRKEKIVK